MEELNRIGVSIEAGLLERFDEYIEKHHYPSRSEAFRDLIRAALSDDASPGGDTPVVATVTLVYDHRTRRLSDRMTSLQHEHHDAVVSTMHVHLDADDCLEVIVLRGAARTVRELGESLIAMKGVRRGQIFMSGSDPSKGPTACP